MSKPVVVEAHLHAVTSRVLHSIDPEQYHDEVLRVLRYWPRQRYLGLAPRRSAPPPPGRHLGAPCDRCGITRVMSTARAARLGRWRA